MVSTHLILLLQILSPKELQQFHDFVYSPFFNKSENCSQLYSALYEYAPHFDSPGIQKDRLAKKLYTSSQSNNSLNVDISKLTKLLEEFISLQQLGKFSTRQKNVPEKESLEDAFLNKRILLLQFLLHRKCYPHFERVNKQVNKLIERVQRRGEKWYYYKSQMADLLFQYSQLQPSKTKQVYLDKLIEDFEKYNLLLQLKAACEAITMQAVIPFNYSKKLTYAIIDQLETDYQHYMESPLIDLYFWFWKTFDENGRAGLEQKSPNEDKDKIFDIFLKKIIEHTAVIDKTELIAFYTGAINYCYRQLRKEVISYQEKLFDLYKSMVENDLILSTNTITPRRFMNIVSVGAQCNKFDWTQQFIADFTPHLPPGLRQSIHHFSNALMAFYQKDYEVVLEHLFFGEIKDVFFTINQKVLLLKTYYELSDAVGFFSQSKSFIKFLQTNKKIPAQQVKAYKNFTSISEHLIRLKHYPNEKKRTKITEDIQQKVVASRAWLLEKVGELK